MQGAASVALVCRPLAGRAFSGLGAAPLAGPIGAKTPWDTLLKVGVWHAEISTSFGVSLHPILDGVARNARLGPRTATRATLTNTDWAQTTPIIGRQYEVQCPRPVAP